MSSGAIEYVVGDVTEPVETPGYKPAIAHVCNDIGVWGAGFTAALDRKWPEVGRRYRRWNRSLLDEGDFLKLKDIHLVALPDGPLIFNMVAQRGVRGPDNRVPLDLEALDYCLGEVFKELASRGDRALHMPRIGCGLAGGNWEDVVKLVCKYRTSFPVFVYDLKPSEL